jgi:hypothetical protein
MGKADALFLSTGNCLYFRQGMPQVAETAAFPVYAFYAAGNRGTARAADWP